MMGGRAARPRFTPQWMPGAPTPNVTNTAGMDRMNVVEHILIQTSLAGVQPPYLQQAYLVVSALEDWEYWHNIKNPVDRWQLADKALSGDFSQLRDRCAASLHDAKQCRAAMPYKVKRRLGKVDGFSVSSFFLLIWLGIFVFYCIGFIVNAASR